MIVKKVVFTKDIIIIALILNLKINVFTRVK